MTNQLQVGAPLPIASSIQPSQSGFVFEFGDKTPAPTIYVALENPTASEVRSASSAGVKEYGICLNGPMTFLMGRYSLDGKAILSFDAPYYAGLGENISQSFFSNLVDFANVITSNSQLGLSLLTVVYDLHSKIVLGINCHTLPNRSSQFLLKHAIKQVSAPIGYEEYIHWIMETYDRYPSFKSMRKHAITWQKVAG